MDRHRARSRIAHYNDTPRYTQSREEQGVGSIRGAVRHLTNLCGGGQTLEADLWRAIEGHR